MDLQTRERSDRRRPLYSSSWTTAGSLSIKEILSIISLSFICKSASLWARWLNFLSKSPNRLSKSDQSYPSPSATDAFDDLDVSDAKDSIDPLLRRQSIRVIGLVCVLLAFRWISVWSCSAFQTSASSWFCMPWTVLPWMSSRRNQPRVLQSATKMVGYEQPTSQTCNSGALCPKFN